MRVGFCVSGGGALFRSAVLNAETLGIIPSLLVLEQKAAPSLDTFAADHNISAMRISYAKREEADRILTETCINADLNLLCLTFDKLIPAPLVHHYLGRIINVHPGLLPAFPGMRAMRQALDHGARFLGATIHEVDEQMDHGPIIVQCVQGIWDNDTEATAGARLFNSLRVMYLQVIAWYVEGRIYRDEKGQVRVKNARYGELPISPSVERSFL
jgi:phosphoribosylglycinamide formyltransferase-1